VIFSNLVIFEEKPVAAAAKSSLPVVVAQPDESRVNRAASVLE